MRLLVTVLVSLATAATAQQTNVPGDLVTGETIVLFCNHQISEVKHQMITEGISSESTSHLINLCLLHI